MSKNLLPDDGWQACPSGVLSKLASHERKIQRRRFLLRVGGTGAVLGLGATGAWLLVQDRGLLDSGLPGDKNYGGIRCSKVKDLAKPFLQNQLSSQVARQVEVHLEACPICKNFVKSLAESSELADA